MRRIRYYVFKAGTKLPFAELPAVIHQFLDEQGLKREQPGFSLFLEKKRPISSPIVAFERQQIFMKNPQNK